jgi:hypothetical protein
MAAERLKASQQMGTVAWRQPGRQGQMIYVQPPTRGEHGNQPLIIGAQHRTIASNVDSKPVTPRNQLSARLTHQAAVRHLGGRMALVQLWRAEQGLWRAGSAG